MRRFDVVVTCVCALLLGYFAFHAVQGQRGLPHRDALTARALELKDHRDGLVRDRLQLEQKVALLRPESIDPDLLDELARGMLMLSGPGDVVAFTGKKEP